jgi:Flp pilus assembly protein TadD
VQVNFTAYVAYIHNNSDSARANNDAVSHLLQGDVEGALTLLQTTLSTSEPAVLNNYGVALILQGDFDKGYEYIYKAAVLQPQDPYFRKNYLYLHELKK